MRNLLKEGIPPPTQLDGRQTFATHVRKQSVGLEED